MTLDQFSNQVQDLGYDSSTLDDLVHEVASCIASNVNNEGIAGQLEYLKEHGWDEQAILNWLKEGEEDVA